MASVCHTPPLLARKPVLQHDPLRARNRPNRIIQHTPDQQRPNTPRFLDQMSVSGVFGNVAGSATCSAQPGPSKLANPASNLHGKRVAEVIDLTHTTGGVSGSSSARQSKRSRTASTITVPAKTTTLASAKATEAKRRSKARREKAEQQDKLTAESISWRQKYKKAFPTFVFYFDAIDSVTEGGMVKAVERLGATVDNFFSKKVTHVITSRAVPPAGKENVNSPALPSHFSKPSTNGSGVVTLFESSVGPTRTNKRIKQSPTSYAHADGQKLQQHDGLEKNPFIDSKDILSRASEFGLKIWRLEKAELIVTRMNSYSPAKTTTATTRTLSLPSLLRDEQLFGTRERDPFVPRLDTHYFPPKSCYVLVEDSTGEHRPVVTKEYERAHRSGDIPWPVLWGGIEGRGGFYRYEGPPIKYERRLPPPVARPVLAAVQPAGFAVAAARAVGGAGAPDLRRTVSLSNLRKNQPARQGAAVVATAASKPAYIAASGNSQTITSNIASGTSTRSGCIPGGVSGMPDKRLAILERSMVSMGSGLAKGMLPGKLRRSTSVDAGLNVKAPAPRSEPKKPGYCENCRIKYDDFKEHVVARKHRKFALNDANWTDLDELLKQIGRPRRQHSSPEYEGEFGEGDSGFFDGEDVCGEEDISRRGQRRSSEGGDR